LSFIENSNLQLDLRQCRDGMPSADDYLRQGSYFARLGFLQTPSKVVGLRRRKISDG